MRSVQSGSNELSRDELAASVAELRRLVRAVEAQLEDERAHFARFLHDEVSQTLTVLRLNIEALRTRATVGEAEEATLLDEMDTAVQATAAAARRLISELRPGMMDR